ncbi:inactive tyrosine-protein kinase PRAG1 [Osmerus mordax]|uniref:inactive tyrosine-protein kinase PRAG1 n=1 Tax=Osmerus mordax TaxID=8014 RepID=UPI00350EC315
MSACGEFAEHVWKPGSCKNCFHPRSAHPATGGSIAPACLRVSQAGEEEDGMSVPSPYSKPTIAVRPTMMLNTDANETLADLGVSLEQDNQKSPVDRLGLKKMLDLAPLYIDSNGCSKTVKDGPLQNPMSPPRKTGYTSRFSPGPLSPSSLFSPLSPPPLPKDSLGISSVFVTHGDGRGPQGLRENGGGGEAHRSQVTRSIKSPFPASNGMLTQGSPGSPDPPQAHVGMPLSISIITTPALASTIHTGNASSQPPSTSPPPSSASSSTTVTLDSIAQTPQPPGRSSSSFLSDPASLSDCSSYRSSTDSLPGPEGFEPPGPDSPGSPSASSPGSEPGGRQPADSEPIYAESTKRKRRLQRGMARDEGRPQQLKEEVELAGVESQRAKITVMAAHTEENNRTFYLSSPDSAVSTQWPHFSPTALKDPSSPAFRWPSSGSASLGSENTLVPGSSPAYLQPKPQSSPPIPPKRNTRSPKLGTSSLSPVPLPDLPALTLLSPKREETQGKSPTEPPPPAPERRHKFHGSAWSWEGRIEEEEEGEVERESLREKRADQGTVLLNGGAGGAGWREARAWRVSAGAPSASNPPSAPGTAQDNNGTSQESEGEGIATEEVGKHSAAMLAKTASLNSGALEPSPPPPPPKKHHRVCAKLSQSSMDLERCSQLGSVESLTSSFRGLGSASLPSASTDSLHGDTARPPSETGSQDATRLSCASPFPRSPMASPGSPHPDPFPSGNSHGNQLQPPPLPEKKTVSRTISAPDNAGGKPLVRAYPRLPFSGSESNICRPEGPLSSLPSSPLEPRPLYSSSDSLEHCHAPQARPARSRTLDESLKGRGRLGVHGRGSITSSSSPQLSAPLSASGSALHLHTLLSNMDSREGVYSKLGGLYAESLRRLALKCEEHFTRSQRNPLRFDESNWSLFKLTCNKPSCVSGDAVYYSAACASDPSNSYAVKICKSPSAEARQGHLYSLSVQQSMPPHFNLQQDCGHFIACVPQSMLPPEEAPQPPAATNPAQAGGPAQAQAERERVVVITREVPQQSAADFVREWASFHQAQPEVYERRVCFLLLQLCSGLEHLKEHGVTHRDLCLENLLLVPHRRHASAPADAHDQRLLPRLLVSNFAKAKRRSAEDAAAANADPRFKRDHARLAPEIVSAAQYRKFDEFQTGILIYELLHQPNPFEVSPTLRDQDYRCDQLPPIPPLSLYSAGLQSLARLLLQPDPIKRIHILEAKRALQGLLWGPRRDLLEQQWDGGPGGASGAGPRHEGLLNWLDVKRALLMMKFAERSLEPERNAELEDWLCCQYFSSAHPLSLCHTAELLYALK